jgi:hypothetical protein
MNPNNVKFKKKFNLITRKIMEEIFKHIQFSELIMISIAYGIGQYWFLFKRDIDAISNTDFIFLKLISKSFRLMIILEVVFNITYYGFIIYSWYSINWKVALSIFVTGILMSLVFNLIYKSNSKLKSIIETFFIFLFFLQPILIGYVVFNFIVRNQLMF